MRADFDATIALSLPHRVWWCADALEAGNPVLAGVMPGGGEDVGRAVVVIDEGLAAARVGLEEEVRAYFAAHEGGMAELAGIEVIVGGERAKNDPAVYERLLDAMDGARLCRWSYLLVIGGGAVLDVAGFAAATVHRGVRLVRMPSTTLAQADSGIGVKNGVNWRGKKNFLGTFAVPWAVVNDAGLVETLSDRDWRCGLSEVVKVALLKSPALFDQMEQQADVLAKRDEAAARGLWRESARLHFEHIVSGGDPFELTRARPLDFGHWAGHRLEQMTGYRLRHGEAVAIGLGLDVTYAAMMGWLDENEARRICGLLTRVGFSLYDHAMDDEAGLLEGLEAFREHLGGRLTVTMIRGIGQAMEVHEIDEAVMMGAMGRLAFQTKGGTTVKHKRQDAKSPRR